MAPDGTRPALFLAKVVGGSVRLVGAGLAFYVNGRRQRRGPG